MILLRKVFPTPSRAGQGENSKSRRKSAKRPFETKCRAALCQRRNRLLHHRKDDRSPTQNGRKKGGPKLNRKKAAYTRTLDASRNYRPGAFPPSSESQKGGNLIRLRRVVQRKKGQKSEKTNSRKSCGREANESDPICGAVKEKNSCLSSNG